MATDVPMAGGGKLALISDFPIDEELMGVVRQLWGGNTSDQDVLYGVNQKWCQWPCSVPYERGEVRDLGFQIYLCATFLSQRRKIVERIHQLGCNLELCFDVCGPLKYFSLASATMKQLSDLEIQLSFHPRSP